MSKCKYYKPYMDTLKLIVKQYYGLDNCVCGGPLHILLDDDNYDIKSVNYCIERCFEELPLGEYSTAECVLGIMICNEYAKMSLEERACFDAYLCGQTLECRGGRHCEECEDILGELYESMKEVED